MKRLATGSVLTRRRGFIAQPLSLPTSVGTVSSLKTVERRVEIVSALNNYSKIFPSLKYYLLYFKVVETRTSKIVLK